MLSGQVGMGGGADPGSDRSQEAIGLRETDRARRMTYWIHHYHTSIAFPPICEKTKLASAHRLVIQTDCQQHCTSSEVWLLSSISSDGAESARSGLFIYIRMSWWDFFKCKEGGKKKTQPHSLNTLWRWSQSEIGGVLQTSRTSSGHFLIERTADASVRLRETCVRSARRHIFIRTATFEMSTVVFVL